MCPRSEQLRAHGAGRENRTHLAQLGELAPHQSASPAIVPPVGLEPTHFRVRTGCSALELRRHDAATSHATSCRCHPLESNQNLPVFSRARTPDTPESDSTGMRARRHVVVTIQLSIVRSERLELPSTVSETVVLAARRTPIEWVHLESNQIAKTPKTNRPPRFPGRPSLVSTMLHVGFRRGPPGGSRWPGTGDRRRTRARANRAGCRSSSRRSP